VDEAGGLACTDVTPEGFLFDMGGHVIFSHYKYFDELIDAAVGEGDAHWNTLQRVSYVWLKDRWVAYPFQNNISALGKDDQIECLQGLVDAKVLCATAQGKPANFDEWILRVMGEGIANIFMRPYNFKVWAVPTTDMQSGWLGERVATVDVKKAIHNVLYSKEEGNWGPNAVFRFPKEGGTGGIWKAVAKLLPQDRMDFGAGYKLVSVDKDAQVATLANGEQVRYKALISTVPLDIMCQMTGKPEWAPNTVDGLFRSNSNIVGIGLRGLSPHGSKCWLYYPEDDCPFYRTTVFSNYARKNCPGDEAKLPTLMVADGREHADAEAREGPWWSLMFEVSQSEKKPLDLTPTKLPGIAGTWPKVVADTIQGAINTKLIRPEDEIVSIYHRRIDYGYPTPSVGRDSVVNKALPYLKEHNIWNRGRFGSWKYEVANQDHSCMLGVEAADNIMVGAKELTLNHPGVVNPTKNMETSFKSMGRLG
tara:strand:- start:355 stop:1788 length:1434 start_codon:yes stop_codon:yes gene_type:complete